MRTGSFECHGHVLQSCRSKKGRQLDGVLILTSGVPVDINANEPLSEQRLAG